MVSFNRWSLGVNEIKYLVEDSYISVLGVVTCISVIMVFNMSVYIHLIYRYI